MEIKAKLPKMGGGAIIQLLDKNGKETYNSGFVQNDLTDAGVMYLVRGHIGDYNRTNTPAGNSKNVLFQRTRHTSLGPPRVANSIILYDDESNKNWERSTAMVSVGSEGNYDVGYASNPLVVDDKIYIRARSRTTFDMGEVSGKINRMSFKLGNEIVSTLEFEENFEVTSMEQLIVTYFRFAEVSDFFELPSAPNTNLKTKILPPHTFPNGAIAYYNPLVSVYSFDGNITNVNRREYNFIGVKYFGTVFNSLKREVKIRFYLGEEQVNELEFTGTSRHSCSVVATNNNSELSRTTTFTIEIPPTTSLNKFDRMVFNGGGGGDQSILTGKHSSFKPKRTITIDFPEPITKDSKGRFDLSFSITLQGGRDELDLDEILPLLPS